MFNVYIKTVCVRYEIVVVGFVRIDHIVMSHKKCDKPMITSIVLAKRTYRKLGTVIKNG